MLSSKNSSKYLFMSRLLALRIMAGEGSMTEESPLGEPSEAKKALL